MNAPMRLPTVAQGQCVFLTEVKVRLTDCGNIDESVDSRGEVIRRCLKDE
jgi:hypothetical protein